MLSGEKIICLSKCSCSLSLEDLKEAGGLPLLRLIPVPFEMPRFINGILVFTGVDEPAVSVGFVL
jgi:hypothetical protein